MRTRIECLIATINSSIVSSGKTALENNFSWTFGPGEHASVTSHSNDITIPLRLVDNLYPLPRNLFTAKTEDFRYSAPPTTVFTCKPCARQPTYPAHAKKELSILDRARAAAAKLTKTSSPKARAEGSNETADVNRRTSTPQTPTLKERPFGSTLERA